jgi:flagellar M-ring protein FliF
VDGLYARGANGELTYQPRAQEELDRIAALVRTAIGFDRNRGDQIEVVNLRFADAPQAIELKEESLVSSLMNPSKDDLLRFAELAVMVLLTLIVLLTVVRPLVMKIIGPESTRRQTVAALAIGSDPSAPLPAARESQASKMIELARVNGQVQQQSIERIGELVKGNPSETVSVLRQWIHERT